MASTHQTRHRLGDMVHQMLQLHKPSDADLSALSTLFSDMAALSSTPPERTHELAAVVESWIAAQ